MPDLSLSGWPMLRARNVGEGGVGSGSGSGLRFTKGKTISLLLGDDSEKKGTVDEAV